MKSTLPFVTFDHAQKLVVSALSAGLAVILRGSPSSGKTAIGAKVAKAAGLKPIVFSLMDHDPTDISGLPDLAGDKATFKPFDTFPVEGDPLTAGCKGWLLCLDEFSSVTREI